MIILQPASEDEVYVAWIKSELYRLNGLLTEQEEEALFAPIGQRTDEKKEILWNKLGRSAILSKLPQNFNWHKVKVKQEDLENIFVVPVYDWFLDSGKTFLLKDVPSNLAQTRGHNISNLPLITTTHYEKIEAIHNSENIEGNLIMITSSINSGKHTLIDGTHRGSALIIDNHLVDHEAYIGVSPEVVNSIWSMEYSNHGDVLVEFNRLVDGGYLW